LILWLTKKSIRITLLISLKIKNKITIFLK
jgi:hypothetical protein